MTRFTRALVALSLFISAPGLVPYQAAAQTMGASRVTVAPAGIGSSGSAINAPALGGASLSAASLDARLIPSLTPAAGLAPAMAAVPAVSAPIDSALAVVSPAKIAPPAPSPGARKLSANRPPAAALEPLASALAAPSSPRAPDADKSALDAAYDAAAPKPAALDSAVRAAASKDAKPGLERSEGPRWVFRQDEPEAPRTSAKRTWAVGLLGATVPLAITVVAITAAQLLGYQLHPDYKGPMISEPSVIQALALVVGTAIVTPIAEEAIFRGGLQGTLAKITKKLRLGDFVVPAVIVSTFFVALHETSDPVLFGTRFVQAMTFAWIYKKEGILAAMAAHGLANGLIVLPFLFWSLGLPWLELLLVPAAIWASIRAAKFLRSQKPDIRSGALAPKPLTPMMALFFAAMLAAGYFLLIPNLYWVAGAAALIYAAGRKSRD